MSDSGPEQVKKKGGGGGGVDNLCRYSGFSTSLLLRSVIIYYFDMSVLLENTPLVKFIQNYIRDPSGVFFISSLVTILMTSFPTIAPLFIQPLSEKWRVCFFCLYKL